MERTCCSAMNCARTAAGLGLGATDMITKYAVTLYFSTSEIGYATGGCAAHR